GGNVHVLVDRVPGSVRLRVVHTGQGIAAAYLPYVFDRFRQADSTSTRSHGGLGIGLTIVRHIIELHGGTVNAESAGEGRGATFTVTVPAAIVPVLQESSALREVTDQALLSAGATPSNGDATTHQAEQNDRGLESGDASVAADSASSA